MVTPTFPPRTIDLLRDGTTVELEGCFFAQDTGPIRAGDWYVAQRHRRTPRLLTARKFCRFVRTAGELDTVDVDHSDDDCSFVVPAEMAYCYNTDECVKVREVSGPASGSPAG